MSTKRKQYLREDDVPLTKYAAKQLKKTLKNDKKEVQNVSTPSGTIDTLDCMRESIEQNTRNIECDRSINDVSYEQILDNQTNSFCMLSIDENNENEDSMSDMAYSSDEELTMLLTKKVAPSNSIKELIDDKQFLESISLNVNKSPAELLLMILKYSTSNRLSFTGISNLLKLINCMLGGTVLSESRYKIDKLCSPVDNVTFHGVCNLCTKYIGTFQDLKELVHCENCNASIDMSNPSSRCFFAMLNPSDAIKDYIETHEKYYDYVVKERQHETNHIRDIYDGRLYRNFVQNLEGDDRYAYATVVFNTDSAPVFKSSQFSIWPIYLILNEIPIQERFNSSITAGLWFGLNKPEMSIYLDIFVEMINNLSTFGIPCTIKGEERHIKVYALLSSVDTVARSPMNGTSQFNAHDGCDWCMHHGKYYEGSMRYEFKVPLPQNRTHASTIVYATEALRTNRRIFGVTTASPLLKLRNFDIIEGFTPDYMHCYAAGIAQQFTEYILGHLTRTDVEYMDRLFENIKAPHQIGRLSRLLQDRRNWKAREYENWVLYYSIPLLSAVLKHQQIFQHWSYLVEALHICLQPDITFSQLNRANEMLHKFVSEAENMYSLRALTYNVHQLLHLVNSVYNWGPLYVHSTYPFESANHKLLTAIHSAKGVILQIIRYDNIQRSIKILENIVYPNCSQPTLQYCEDLTNQTVKNTLKLSTITYFGKEKSVSDCLVEKFDISKSTKVFYKMVLRGSLFMTCRKINKRSCNFFAQLSNGKFVKLIDFLVDEKNNKELTVCQVIKTNMYRYSSFIRTVSEFSNEVCIETNEILKTCIFIETETKQFIIPVPNQLFY